MFGKIIGTCLGILTILAASSGATQAQTQAVDAAQAAAQTQVKDHGGAMLDELAAMVRYPNVGTNPDDILSFAEHLTVRLVERGFAVEAISVPGANPSLWATRDTPGAKRTVTFYIHYDGQPVEPANWASPPFEPTLRDGKLGGGGKVIPLDSRPLQRHWRLYGRATSDDRAPIIAFLHALDALDTAGIAPSVNIRLFLEGEEEMGSPNLAAILDAHKAKLQSDFWVFLDGPQKSDGRPQMALGARGVTGFELTIYGADGPLHSGHYGNFAPNPIQRLAALLGSMRAPDGRVLIDGFYEEAVNPSKAELAAIADEPIADAQVMDSIGIAASEPNGRRLEEAILYPALNFLGLSAGGVGNAKRNAIPNSATAAVGIRMVPDMTVVHLERVVRAHVADQGYLLVDEAPTPDLRRSHDKIARVAWDDNAYGSVRTPVDAPEARAVKHVLTQVHGDELVTVISMGGSLPLAPIVNVLDVPVVLIPIANADNNQHAPNENIRLGNLFDGVKVYAALLAGLDDAMNRAEENN